MPVSVMLRTLTSRELTEWRAYELKNGPLDDMWRDEARSNSVDLLRLLTYLISQAHFSDEKKSVKGPVEHPKKKYLRPWDMYYPEPEPEESSENIEEHDAQQVAMLNAVLNAREMEQSKES